MVRKLKAKGFTTAYVSEEFGELLKGEFNGNMVDIMIQTNSNKVKRIIVSSDGLSETNVKIRYNNLVYQFYNNTKYIHSDSDNFIIPNDEDISYELTVNKKNYQATFFQKGENGSLDGIEYRPVWFTIMKGLSYNEYSIVLYYENGYNDAHGEDL